VVELTRFADHVVVVIGGGRGIGRATALRFAAEGAHVVVADNAVEFAKKVSTAIDAAGGTSEAHYVDVTDKQSVDALLRRVGDERGIDVLVTTPARASDTDFEEISMEEFDTDLAITLKGPFLAIQVALPYLMNSPRGGNVVTIGSVNGLQAFGNESYSAAKAGLINLVKNLAIRYGSKQVRFNVVAPGTIHTRTWAERVEREPTIIDTVARLYPLGRVGQPEDVAAAILFLASSDAQWITGVTLPVDGGITAGHPEVIGTIFREASTDSTS
jgi:meso-butanediol dehydrogenase/(S,S)-butanediol dehydrogenase/diacetyl reductase